MRMFLILLMASCAGVSVFIGLEAQLVEKTTLERSDRLSLPCPEVRP